MESVGGYDENRHKKFRVEEFYLYKNKMSDKMTSEGPIKLKFKMYVSFATMAI